MSHRLRCFVSALGLTLALTTYPVRAEVPAGATATEAIRLYDAGDYAGARELLESLDAAGQLDGQLTYRLYFCQRRANASQALDTLRRTVTLLETEAGRGLALDTAFYLGNAYQNQGRDADMRRISEQAIARIESNAWTPTSGLDRFRVGKLYADLGRPEAATWYASALDAMVGTEQSYPAYVQWASRYLAERAYAAGNDTDAAAYFGTLAEAGGATIPELDLLARAQCRLGRYAAARDAWRRAEALDRTIADRPRYAWRVADMAAQLEALPASDPSGRPWTELSREELEEAMAREAAAVRAAREEAQQSKKKLKKKQRATLQRRIDDARPLFVAAALQYVVEGHPIRETAFLGGYAPLIFQTTEWELPAPPQ